MSHLNQEYSDKLVKTRKPGTSSTLQWHISAVRRRDRSCPWQLTPPFIGVHRYTAAFGRTGLSSTLKFLEPTSRNNSSQTLLVSGGDVMLSPVFTASSHRRPRWWFVMLSAHLNEGQMESSCSPPPASPLLFIHPTTSTKSTWKFAVDGQGRDEFLLYWWRWILMYEPVNPPKKWINRQVIQKQTKPIQRSPIDTRCLELTSPSEP